MLFADASQTQDLVVTAGGYVLALIFGLLLLLRLGKNARKAAHASTLKSRGIVRIDSSELILDACYTVHDVLVPIEQPHSGTLVFLTLGSFEHLGDRVPQLQVQMMLRPDTCALLLRKRTNGQPIAMQWTSRGPTFE